MAGNSAFSNVQAVTVDTIAIAGSLALGSDFADSGFSAADRITNDNTFSIVFSGQETGSKVMSQRSTDGGSTWSDTTVSQNSLADGSYQFRALYTDVAGNTAPSATEGIIIDTVKPIPGELLVLDRNEDDPSLDVTNQIPLSLIGHEAGAIPIYQISRDFGDTWESITNPVVSSADDPYILRAQSSIMQEILLLAVYSHIAQ